MNTVRACRAVVPNCGFCETRVHSILGDAQHCSTARTLPRPPCGTFRRVVAPLRGPGQSPVLPFACCVGSLLSVGRCGRCSCWCRFRVRGAQSLVCWGFPLRPQLAQAHIPESGGKTGSLRSEKAVPPRRCEGGDGSVRHGAPPHQKPLKVACTPQHNAVTDNSQTLAPVPPPPSPHGPRAHILVTSLRHKNGGPNNECNTRSVR